MKAVGKHTTLRTFPKSFAFQNKGFFAATMFKGEAVTWAAKSRLSVTAHDRFNRGNRELYARSSSRAGWIANPTQYVKSPRWARGAPERMRPRKVVHSAKGIWTKTRSASGLGRVLPNAASSTSCNAR